ncbi:Uncharacterised protein [Mycobacteroides abscessus subsp. abscessus]|nr:Uncharacterised protein [Mycobacteroides abscessus subsp. abscessus]
MRLSSLSWALARSLSRSSCGFFRRSSINPIMYTTSSVMFATTSSCGMFATARVAELHFWNFGRSSGGTPSRLASERCTSLRSLV